MSPQAKRFCILGFWLILAASPGRLDAQAASEAELRSKIQKLEKELAGLRDELERMGGKKALDVTAVLEQDYQQLLKKDRRRSFVRQAAQQFVDTSSWGYLTGLEILRKNRARAAIPLCLKHLIENSANARGAAHYFDTLTILTGEDVKALALKHGTVANLAQNWWIPRKQEIIVDMNQMSRAQIETIVVALLAAAASAERSASLGRREFSVYNLSQQLAGRSAYDRPPWFDDEIHPAMLPILLERCGIAAADQRPPAAQPLDFHAIAMLAQLRKLGEAPGLDDIAKDHRQTAGARLSCMLATLAAGDDLSTEMLLDLYRNEKNLEIRVIAVLRLSSTTTPRQASGQLLQALDDANLHIRTAAILALGNIPVPAALPKLAQRLGEAPPAGGRGDAQAIMRTITHLGSPAAKQVLADHLQACLQKNDMSYAVYYALSAFQTITGQRWTAAGAHDTPYYRAQAAKALQWWKAQDKQQP